MRRIAWRVLAALALASVVQTAGLAGPNTTVAYDEGASSEVSALRTEIDALRTEIHASMTTSHEDPQPTPAADQGDGGGGDTCGCQSCGDSGGTCGCFEPYCHATGIWASAELLFFKYHRADGTRAGVLANEATEFDFETSARFTLGWVRCDGLGARVRCWKYDHSAPTAGPDPGGPDDPSALHVDTWTLDFEIFDTFCLNRNWNLELAAGIRYNEFSERLDDLDGVNNVEFSTNKFNGYGAVVSAELRRALCDCGAIWLRARSSILMSDKDVATGGVTSGVTTFSQQVQLKDVVVGTTELAFGCDLVMPCCCDGSYYFARVQAEWQTWYNYSSSFADTADNNNELSAGPSDVGFGGFGFAVGLVR